MTSSWLSGCCAQGRSAAAQCHRHRGSPWHCWQPRLLPRGIPLHDDRPAARTVAGTGRTAAGRRSPSALLEATRTAAGTLRAAVGRPQPGWPYQHRDGPPAPKTTGPAAVLGLPADYRTVFPRRDPRPGGAATGVLVAQQTAANLHARPGTR